MGSLNDSLYVNGILACAQFNAPAGCIGDNAVGSANPIATSKTQHRQHAHYAQPNTTATTETKPLYVCYGATGSLIAFRAGSIAACAGAATITIDLKKNGSSVLSAVITLNSSSTARIVQAATLTSVNLAAGDWLEVVITATAGGGTLGTGVFAELITDELPV